MSFSDRTLQTGYPAESQSCWFLFQLQVPQLTHCNPITFSNNWNAFIPSRGSNLGSHIGSLGSPLRWSFSPHLLPLLAMPFTALSHYLAAYLTSHPPAAFCHIDIWTLASCKMHQFLKDWKKQKTNLHGPCPCILCVPLVVRREKSDLRVCSINTSGLTIRLPAMWVSCETELGYCRRKKKPSLIIKLIERIRFFFPLKDRNHALAKRKLSLKGEIKTSACSHLNTMNPFLDLKKAPNSSVDKEHFLTMEVRHCFSLLQVMWLKLLTKSCWLMMTQVLSRDVT